MSSSKDELVERVNALASAEFDRLVAAGMPSDKALVNVIHGLVSVGATIASAAKINEEKWRNFTEKIWRDIQKEVVGSGDAKR